MDTQTSNQEAPFQIPHDGPQPQAPVAVNRRTQYVRPRAHITESANDFVLQVEPAGVRQDGLEVTFENGELTITGHRTPFQAGSAEPIYRESTPADFRRVFELDPTIDTAKIQARLEQGVLTLALPETESSRPRRIEVQHVQG